VGCIVCHGGVGGVAEKDAAHKGIRRDPTEKPGEACGTCHGEIVKNAATSLHYTQNGYWTFLKTVGVDVNAPAAKEAFANHCADCHTTCGQCHVSRPSYTGGGLLAGHTLKKVASLSDTCMACHGARVGDEYRGNYDGIEGDAHWVKLGMACNKCHSQVSLHGDGKEHATMFDKPETTCLTCHSAVATDTKIQQHALHKDKLSCQVCHAAGAYKNCANCHVGKDAKGLPFRTLDPSWMDFKIGKNPNKTADLPYDYVLVRHVPTNPDLFKAYGIVYPNPNAVSSWRLTTPHNIQRKTTQNASCNNCHGNAKLFLTKDAVKPEHLDANKNVIVETIPPKMGQ
jgi:thiosulfate/3-mercaptopyruvate sulfurtransferase